MTKVLYSVERKVWVLADFGFAVEATSIGGRTTRHSRGSACYRAPELMQYHATFTTRVDMWAMGCVLHELTTCCPAFKHDFAVMEHDHTSQTFRNIAMPGIQPLWQQYLSSLIAELLNHAPEQRPRSADVAQFFGSALTILDDSVKSEIINNAPDFNVPDISWRGACKSEPLLDLADQCDLIGLPDVASEMRGYWITTLRNRAAVQLLRRNSNMVSVFDYIRAVFAIREAKPTMDLVKQGLSLDPSDFWSTYILCCLYLAKHEVKEAIDVCSKSRLNILSRLLLLRYLYAMDGFYSSSIRVEMELIRRAGNIQTLVESLDSHIKTSLVLPEYGALYIRNEA